MSTSDFHTTDELFLKEGEYELIMYDDIGDGICCDYGEGHFNMVVDGRLVLE